MLALLVPFSGLGWCEVDAFICTVGRFVVYIANTRPPPSRSTQSTLQLGSRQVRMGTILRLHSCFLDRERKRQPAVPHAAL